jgi:demethylmenaquinone methyltransferase / 2-methoxy-6-polyprenyl-1,4-benzoquinol methylase
MQQPDPSPEPDVLAPHPVLPAYYGGADERRDFVQRLFDRTASDYERVERWMGFGTGARYRRHALLRAGLQPGMHVLDVAAGTGLVTRAARGIVGGEGSVIALDPSAQMMRSGPRTSSIPIVQATAERLPFPDRQFDFVSLGFALRHLADLQGVFGEFRRVLRPGGIACVLEITPPENRWSRRVLKFYMSRVVPLASHVLARHADTPLLFRYFWDTIEACVPPARVLEALDQAGFSAARRHVEARFFSEYTARC